MNFRLAAIAFLAGLTLGSPVWADPLVQTDPLVQVQSPSILVNCGTGFRAVGNYTPVQPGCRVMASAETGHGYLLYRDCDQELLPGTVYTVRKEPGPEDAKSFRPVCKKAAAGWWPYALAAGGAAVAICAAAGCFEGEHHRPRPASP